MVEISKGVLFSSSVNPYLNLAFEEWLLEDSSLLNDQVLFLWRNSECVIIGVNQNPFAECDFKRMNEEGVLLVRRKSGGGAVFQDSGNTNFTFLSRKDGFDRDRNYGIVTGALKSLGVDAVKVGRNDLCVGDCKISGSAFKEQADRCFHHGTILINVDMERLSGFLTPSRVKLESKGVKSVRSRVGNIKGFFDGASHEVVCDALINEFSTRYGVSSDFQVLSEEDLLSIPEVKKRFDFLKSESWLLGRTPEFSFEFEDRLSWGVFDVGFVVREGKVVEARVFSDALNSDLVKKLQSSLTGVFYSKKGVSEALAHFSEEEVSEFRTWVCEKISV